MVAWNSVTCDMWKIIECNHINWYTCTQHGGIEHIYAMCERELNVISNKDLAKLSLLLKGREGKKRKEKKNKGDKSYFVLAFKRKKKNDST